MYVRNRNMEDIAMKQELRIFLNDDPYLVRGIREKLKENGGYCPCKLVKNEDTKCICKEFRDQNEPGFCTCGLYRKCYCISIREDK